MPVVTETATYNIDANNLTEDLDKIYDDRIKAEEESKLKMLAERKKTSRVS